MIRRPYGSLSREMVRLAFLIDDLEEPTRSYAKGALHALKWMTYRGVRMPSAMIKETRE